MEVGPIYIVPRAMRAEIVHRTRISNYDVAEEESKYSKAKIQNLSRARVLLPRISRVLEETREREERTDDVTDGGKVSEIETVIYEISNTLFSFNVHKLS